MLKSKYGRCNAGEPFLEDGTIESVFMFKHFTININFIFPHTKLNVEDLKEEVLFNNKYRYVDF